MTDREMLELAAKAAGIELTWWAEDIEGGSEHDYPTNWNPLTDDGDALRLAVKLRLIVDPRDKTVSATQWSQGNSTIAHAFEFYVVREQGDMAATRRAIVRAAAEIGRKMAEGAR